MNDGGLKRGGYLLDSGAQKGGDRGKNSNDEEKENRNTLPAGLNCQPHIQCKRQRTGN